MEYRVNGNALEFNVYLTPLTKKSKGCLQFFNLKKIKLPYRQTEANGLVIECMDLLKTQPFGVNLKLIGLAADELAHYANNEVNLFGAHTFDATAFEAAANTTCWGNCTAAVAGKTANVLSYNADLNPGFDLPKTLNLAYDYVMTDTRSEAIAKALAAYDVVGLQELYVPRDSGRKLRFLEQAASVGLTNYALPQGVIPAGFTSDGGQLILSRFPIVARDFALFPQHDGHVDAVGV
jgi:hypothetical protein